MSAIRSNAAVVNATTFPEWAAEQKLMLVPCHAGTKIPSEKWKEANAYTNPELERHAPEPWICALRNGQNAAIVTSHSRKIFLDVDATHVGEDKAYAKFLEHCPHFGFTMPPKPCTRTARGGWHFPLLLPEGIEPDGLRGCGILVKDDAGRELIGFKVRGLVMAPGSTFDGKPYLFYPDVGTPPVCPPELLELLKRPVVEYIHTNQSGTSSKIDVARVVAFLDSEDEFQSEPDWTRAIWAIKAALGDAGIDVAREITWAATSEEAFLDRWRRGKTNVVSGRDFTIGSLIYRANEIARTKGLSDKFFVRPDVNKAFEGIAMNNTAAKIAEDAGAKLRGSDPMMGRNNMISEKGRPIIEAWRAAHAGYVAATDAPPISSLVPIRDELNTAIPILLGISSKRFRTADHADLLAVIKRVCENSYSAILIRLRGNGCEVSERILGPAYLRFDAAVERELRSLEGWVLGGKENLPEPGNSDNVRVFLRIVEVEIRRNAWTNKDEIKWPQTDWRALTDHDYDTLMSIAANTQHNFRPSEPMFKRTMRAIARETIVDPVLDRIAACEAKWDAVARLETWLVNACGVEDNAYHRAVSANVIGGMIKRARQPGCKHDEVMILISDEGKAKTELCRRLALDPKWFSNSVRGEGGDQNMIPQLFGKTVIELAELDMSKKEIAWWKSFISRQDDDVTLKYDRLSEQYPRRGIFIATTNEDEPLLSDTGNRRFLPVRIVGEIDIEWITDKLDHLVGEAAVRERAGETFGIPREVWADAAERQEEARSLSDVEVLIREWFEDAPDDSYVTSADLVLALTATKAGRVRGTAAKALKKLRFGRFKLRMPVAGQTETRQTRGFVKTTEPQERWEMTRANWRQITLFQFHSGAPLSWHYPSTASATTPWPPVTPKSN